MKLESKTPKLVSVKRIDIPNATPVEVIVEDPGYCGLDPLTTGPWDPFWERVCKPHDIAFDKMKAGVADPQRSNLDAFVDFTKNIGVNMAQGAYMLGLGPLYWLIGGVGGWVRGEFVAKKSESDSSSGNGG